jgi:hypothetical protein
MIAICISSEKMVLRYMRRTIVVLSAFLILAGSIYVMKIISQPDYELIIDYSNFRNIKEER